MIISKPSNQILETPLYWRQEVKRFAKERRYTSFTVKNYASVIKAFVEYIGGSPRRAGPAELNKYLAHIKTELGYKASTRNLHVCALKFFYRAVLGMDPPHPLHTKQIITSKPIEELKFSEIVRLFESEKNLRNRLLLKAAYFTGLKISELVGLKISDINIENRALRISSPAQTVLKAISIPQAFFKDFRLYISVGNREGYLFRGIRECQHISARQADKILKAAGIRAGLKKRLTFTMLRNSYIQHLLILGLKTPEIKTRLGFGRSRTIEELKKMNLKKKSKFSQLLEHLDVLMHSKHYFNI